jgi:TonB family protein
MAYLLTGESRPPDDRITYLELSEPQAELEPPPAELEPPPPEAELPEPERKRREREKRRPELEFEELKAPEPEPEAKEEPPPEPPPEEPPPEQPQEKIHFVLEQLKMVEQPDEVDEKDAPQDADYLSNVNRDVREQTRAEITNLERDAVKTQASQEEPSPDKQRGTSNEQVIAEHETIKSQANRLAPQVKPAEREQRPTQDDPKPRSLLAMRDLQPREHQQAREEHDPLASERADGELKRRESRSDTVVRRNEQARIDRNDPSARFRLSSKDMVALFGDDARAAKNFVAREKSAQKGIWDGPRSHFQSPLENMVPEVQVGNQTALRSRKHPFARFIAQMHRAIHESWAWGFLDQMDTRGRGNELNDFALWSRVEIVLNADGTISKVTTVRPSGNMVFDAAARETVWAVGPFPNPPREIVSPNGKIYVHWAFHRDERACGTFGATPFILDGSAGDRPDPGREVRGVAGASEHLGRRLTPRSEGPALPGTATAAAGGGAGGPGAGAAEHGHTHPPTQPEPTSAGATPSFALPAADASDPAAKKVADEWLYYVKTRNLDKVVARSAVPFYAGGRVVARSKQELRQVLDSVLAEVGAGGSPSAAKLYTAAALRRTLGSVPDGVQEGESRIYALTRIGSDLVVLILEKAFSAWRIVGVAR